MFYNKFHFKERSIFYLLVGLDVSERYSLWQVYHILTLCVSHTVSLKMPKFIHNVPWNFLPTPTSLPSLIMT